MGVLLGAAGEPSLVVWETSTGFSAQSFHFYKEWQDAGKWTLQCLVYRQLHKTYYLLCEYVNDVCIKEREISLMHRSVLIEWNNLHNLGFIYMYKFMYNKTSWYRGQKNVGILKLLACY